MRLACQAATVVASLSVMLPLALALFPQQSTIAAASLERELQAKLRQRRSNGGLPDFVSYNKGL
jgi:hypothetical protein